VETNNVFVCCLFIFITTPHTIAHHSHTTMPKSRKKKISSKVINTLVPNAPPEKQGRSQMLYFLAGVLVVLIGTSMFAAQDDTVRENLRVVTTQIVGSGTPRPGIDIAAKGIRAKHPVLFIPGIVSTKVSSDVMDASKCC
jgi:hypothetical protein